MPFHTLSSAPSKEGCNNQRTAGKVAGFLALGVGMSTVLSGLFVGGPSVFAFNDVVLNNLNNASIPAWGTNAQTHIGAVVAQIILVALGLLGVLFVVLLTYGGFLWVTSAGEEDKTKKAMGLIFNAIIGALIVVAAYTITYFVLSKLGVAVGG